MKTKFEAVEHFLFIKDIFSRIKGAGADSDELCGVLFKENYALTTNNHIVGCIKIDDNFPADTPMFWAYNKEEDNIDKLNGERFMLNIGKYISEDYDDIIDKNNICKRVSNLLYSFNESNIFFNKDKLIDFIESEYSTTAKRAKINVNIGIKNNIVNFNFAPVKKSTSVFSSNFQENLFYPPGKIGSVRYTEDSCNVNLLYLYEIIKNSYHKSSVIGLKYRNTEEYPAILYSCPDDACEVYWAITQKHGTIIKK